MPDDPCVNPQAGSSLSVCNVNLVDGLIWSQEAVGSNPTTQTIFALIVKWYNDGFVIRSLQFDSV